jgi:hypothetical protein
VLCSFSYAAGSGVLLGSAIEFIFPSDLRLLLLLLVLLRECRNLISLVRLVRAACVLGP